MFLYWISTSSFYRILPSRPKELQHLQPPPPSHFPNHGAASDDWPFPPSTSSCLSILSQAPWLLHISLCASATRWVGAEPSMPQVVGAVAVRGGTAATPACPPPCPDSTGLLPAWTGGQGLLPGLGTGHFPSLPETLGWEAHRAPHPC